MSGERGHQFVDTNVLVYAHDRSAGSKHVRARELLRELWDSQRGCLSVQVLQELYVTMTRKVRDPLHSDEVARIISKLGTWKVHAPDVADLLEAIEVSESYQISFWDGMVIHSARRLGCEMIWTEDLNAGQDYGGIRAENPFAP